MLISIKVDKIRNKNITKKAFIVYRIDIKFRSYNKKIQKLIKKINDSIMFQYIYQLLASLLTIIYILILKSYH